MTQDSRVSLGRLVPRHPATLQLEKRLERGAWVTRLSHPKDASSPEDLASIASAEFDENGGVIAFYNSGGEKLDVHTERSRRSAAIPPGVTLPGVLAGASSERPKREFGSKLWMDQFVVTPASRARTVVRARTRSCVIAMEFGMHEYDA